jgi:hypothetical protein
LWERVRVRGFTLTFILSALYQIPLIGMEIESLIRGRLSREKGTEINK